MINLPKIFIEQDRLNKETASKHEEYSILTPEELIKNYCFAALAELGECANEWGHFKIWKSTRKENRDASCKKCSGTGIQEDFEQCLYCENGRVNPLQEEYVDVFHFVVSVAIGFGLDPKVYMETYEKRFVRNVDEADTYDLYLSLFKSLSHANVLIDELESYKHINETLEIINGLDRERVSNMLMDTLLNLGYSLGFTNEDIEKAYFSKHEINKVRQENNY